MKTNRRPSDSSSYRSRNASRETENLIWQMMLDEEGVRRDGGAITRTVGRVALALVPLAVAA